MLSAGQGVLHCSVEHAKAVSGLCRVKGIWLDAALRSQWFISQPTELIGLLHLAFGAHVPLPFRCPAKLHHHCQNSCVAVYTKIVYTIFV